MRAVKTKRAALWLPVLLLLGTHGVAQNGAMTFRAAGKCGPDCTEIAAEGVIGLDSADAFRALATRLNGSRVVVQLSSPGGNLTGGIQLGNALREAKTIVIIKKSTRCVSACAYAMLGGTTRRVETGARVGVHRFHPDEAGEAVPKVLADYVLEMLRRYAAQMGADPELINLAANVAPDTVHYLSIDELRRYRVVTEAK